MRDTGGGFGQKIMVQRDEMCLMLAAPMVGAPVKWVEDRRENLLAAGKSRHEHAAVKMAFDADGAIQAAYIDFVQDCGAYPTPWPLFPAAAVGTFFPGPYRVPRGGFAVKTLYTNTVGRAPYRGPWQFESLAREVLLDIAARQMGMDPAELRRRNLLRRDELPYKNPNGMAYDNISPLETFEQALAMLDYDAFRAEQAEARKAGRYLGVGMSNYVEPSTPGYGAYATETATIRIEPSGRVTVYIAGGSSGNSIETTVVQLAADALGAKIEDVDTIQGDTAVTGFGAGAAGSRSASMTRGRGARDGERRCASASSRIAAHQLGAATDDIELADSRASVRGKPAQGISFEELAALAYDPTRCRPESRPGSRRAFRYTANNPAIWVNAHASVYVRGRRDHGPRAAPALHRERGLRADDQPERRRGTDRRRHRAGHRRRAARAPRLRRGRQPRHDDVHGLPAADRGRGARDRVRAHRDAEPRPGRLQGRGRGRRDRRSAGRRQRGGRRARRRSA